MIYYYSWYVKFYLVYQILKVFNLEIINVKGFYSMVRCILLIVKIEIKRSLFIFLEKYSETTRFFFVREIN